MATTPTVTTAKADPSKSVGSKQVTTAPFRITGKPTISARYIKMMVYGAPGSGKTTLMASAVDVPHMQDVLFIDAEKGEMTIDDNDRIMNAGEIDRIRITDFSMVAQVQEYLKAHCHYRDAGDIESLRKLEARAKGIDPSEIETPKQYRTAIVDSLSEINEFCMYQLLSLSTDMKLDVNTMDVAEWPEFRKNNQMMQLLVRAYRDLPMNILFTCSIQYTQDETKRKFFAPNITGKLAGQVQGFMDIVGYIQTGKVPEGKDEAPRRVYIQPVGNFDAKNRRSSYKKAYFENPTMSTVMSDLGLNK